MTKTNAQAKIAEKVNADIAANRGKKVLTEEDLVPAGGETVAAMKKRLARELAAEAKAEGTERAANIGKEAKGLARGLDARNSPHSAKSVQDDRAKAKASNKTDKVAEKAKKQVERKAERAAKAAPKADDARKITIVDKKFTFGREGTARNLSWLACTKAKTVADYAKAGGALKYLPRWVSAGAIKLG